mmetsp:Transcript_18573/g.21342  ORF Transcript_18573/g.21342 Transcript_18573/m.21342 type:complete len:86 (+) Transcript_18573:226-483(+)
MQFGALGKPEQTGDSKTAYCDILIDVSVFPECKNIEQIKEMYKRKFDRLSLTHKTIIKEMIDHKLVKSNMEALKFIDDFGKLEEG